MKKHLPMKHAWLFVAAAFILVAASTAGAQPGEFVKGVLQPLADGFPNRAITLVVVDDAGSPDGIMARMLKEALKNISPVDILISDEPAPAFGTFYTLRDVLSRKGGDEGYYPIIVTVFGAVSDLYIEPIEKEIDTGIEDMKMINILETVPYLIAQRKNTP